MTATWVLLRGLARDSRHWESFPSRLRAALGGEAQVLAVDLPGNGALASRRSPASVRGMVEAYRESTGGRPVHLLGLSLGAMAAVEWAHRFPREVASMVLVNASAGGVSRPWQRLRPPAAWTLLTARHREAGIVSVCSNLADTNRTIESWTGHARSAVTSPMNTARQLLAAIRFRLPLSPPGVPTLVVASAADRLVSVECSIVIARRCGWPLLLHPSAGHEIALDDPAWLARQCARWAAGLEHLGS